MRSNIPSLYAVILAGGKGARMGNMDKPLIVLENKPLIEWGLQRIQGQVAKTVISVNHNFDRYEYLNLDLVVDSCDQYKGPLVGIYSAIRWIQKNVKTDIPSALLCIPADVPFFPKDLISILWDQFASSNYDVAWCQCDGQIQPLFSIWSLSCRDKLKEAIAGGLFGPKLVIPSLNNRLVSIEKESDLDFLNINDSESLKSVQKMINSQ